jgi:hypothetical protein
MLMPTTVKTGVMLVGGAPSVGILRFECEPWTFFYMAGEMIRELEKALENEASARKVPEPPEDQLLGDGRRTYPNERTTALPDATGYSE